MGAGVSTYQEKRYSLFAQNIGLIWDAGEAKFTNLEEKVEYYNDQVNDAAGLYTAAAAKNAGLTDLPGGCYFMAKMSMNPVSRKLLRCFFKKLEETIPFEQ